MREKTLPRCHVRWMIRRDMPTLLAIERASFPQPWGEEDFLHCLNQRNCIGMVAELPGEEGLAGYMIYELRKRSLHLLNFAVHPRHRREGFGSLLVRKLASKLGANRRDCITANVRESNLPGQLFFRSCGFRATGVIRGHYEDTGEDAYRMVHCPKG